MIYPFSTQTYQPGNNLEITNRRDKYCRPWKSQLSQTVEVTAVTDRGSHTCRRSEDRRVEHPHNTNYKTGEMVSKTAELS
ncbi:hypothetical protein LSAT2_005251 [Lamellibrachia satsuma]|nr:hypothetical protein LSAT2_005251 [Lamellibrachia satsuma]